MANRQQTTLMEYLGEEYSRTLPDGVSDEVLRFLEFADNHLMSNPPVSLEQRVPGMGLRMRNGVLLCLIPGQTQRMQTDVPPGNPNVQVFDSPQSQRRQGFHNRPQHPGDSGNIF